MEVDPGDELQVDLGSGRGMGRAKRNHGALGRLGQDRRCAPWAGGRLALQRRASLGLGGGPRAQPLDFLQPTTPRRGREAGITGRGGCLQRAGSLLP